MTKEQIIVGLNKMLDNTIKANECGLSNNDFKDDIELLKTVLSMLKEKDKKIEYYKKQKDYDMQFRHELLEQIRCLNLDKDHNSAEIEKKNTELTEKNAEIERLNRQIDLMTEEINETDRGYIDYCQFKMVCDRNCKECIKQYFERKCKE